MKTHGPIEAVGAAVSPPPAVLTPAHDTMRRLQIGIAGLLTVLLLVGLAGVIGHRARESAAKDGAATAKVQMPGEVAASKPAGDRKSVVKGESVSVGVEPGGRGTLKKK